MSTSNVSTGSEPSDSMCSRCSTQRRACTSLRFYSHPSYGRQIPESQYLRNMYVSDKHKAIFCLIPKVGSSTWVGTLLVLEEYLNSTAGMSTKQIVTASKKHIKGLKRYSDKVGLMKNHTMVLFVRNPYTRLLSAFRDRLETYPNRNIFHRRTHNKNIYMMFGNHSKDEMPAESVKSELYNVTFKEFVDYYISGKTDVHWREQYKVCPPCLDYDFIGKIETFADDYNNVLKLLDAETKVPLIKAAHATHSSEDEILKSYYGTLSDLQFKRLFNVLKTDMKLYGYEIPDAIKRPEIH